MSLTLFPSAANLSSPTSGVGWAVYHGAIVAALGGLLFGFDTAVISGAEKALGTVFQLNTFWLGFTVAVALIGTMLGAAVIEKPTDVWGRRKTLFFLAALYFVSSLGCAVAGTWWFFIVFRFMGGVAIGGTSVVAPMYIAEISPARLRGRLVAINQLNIVLGILLSFVSNYFIARVVSEQDSWRWMLGFVAVPSALFFVLLFGIVESPRWLAKVGRFGEALVVLVCLGERDADGELDKIKASLQGDVGMDRLFQRQYLFPIFLAWAIAMFNQLSGINAVMYYAPRIFEMTGSGKDAALLETVAVGATNLLFTIAAIFLIDRFGRRNLLLVGSIGYILSLGTTAWSFAYYGGQFTSLGSIIVLSSLLVFIASHAFGQGAVIWVFISEIFPTAVRAKGQAFGTFTHWFMAALVSWTFPVIAAQSSAGAFAFFASLMVLQLLFAWKIMPETKGRTLENLEKQLTKVSAMA
ncbi:MAG TPA: sugar porter family MFS transporter [Candidatus Methylacidiphilales bacterium]